MPSSARNNATGGSTRVAVALPTTGVYTIVLPMSGTDTLVITPIISATTTPNLTHTLSLHDALPIYSPFDLNIPFRNQQARLTFNGTAGQNVGVNISTQTLTSGGTKIGRAHG